MELRRGRKLGRAGLGSSRVRKFLRRFGQRRSSQRQRVSLTSALSSFPVVLLVLTAMSTLTLDM